MPAIRTDDGGVLSYDEWGAGPVVVLIHGSPGTAKAWQRVGERLGERFRVIAPNLPGYGETAPEPTGGRGDSSHAAEMIERLAGEVGAPLVLAGHSYGGVVALRVGLRARVEPGAIALFEPVAVPVLEALGDARAFAEARAVFEDYTSTVDAGDSGAVRTMVDYWFGGGAFERMPAATREFLLAHTGHNVRDVRATFRERYTPESLGRLAMPVLVVHGVRSPAVMARICEGIASHAPRGSLIALEGANHAMTATHVEAVAGLIADLADRGAHGPARS